MAAKKSSFSKSKTVKDDCYRKAKAAHKVFPSAYASGMIAKCRKRKANGGSTKAKTSKKK